jgi:ABC-type phosphate/phosphonate transport system substrate-binding protein
MEVFALTLSPILRFNRVLQGSTGGILLTQTCGLPLVTTMSASLQAIAVPCYRVAGCHGSSYSSVVIAHIQSPVISLDYIRQNPGNIAAAVNSIGSLSGCLALQASISLPSCSAQFAALDPGSSSSSSSSSNTPVPAFFKRIDVTGSHADSIAAVCASRDHIACIDCVTFALILQQHPHLSLSIRVIARTPSAPCLPYVTRPSHSENM